MGGQAVPRSNKNVFGSEKYKQSNSISACSVIKETTRKVRVRDVSVQLDDKNSMQGILTIPFDFPGVEKAVGGQWENPHPSAFLADGLPVQPVFCAPGNIQLNTLNLTLPPLIVFIIVPQWSWIIDGWKQAYITGKSLPIPSPSSIVIKTYKFTLIMKCISWRSCSVSWGEQARQKSSSY